MPLLIVGAVVLYALILLILLDSCVRLLKKGVALLSEIHAAYYEPPEAPSVVIDRLEQHAERIEEALDAFTKGQEVSK